MDLNAVALDFLKELDRISRLNADDLKVSIDMERRGGRHAGVIWTLRVHEPIDRHQLLGSAGPSLIDVIYDAGTKLEEACNAWDYRFR